VGGCNAFIPRDFVVRGPCSIPTAPTNILMIRKYLKFPRARAPDNRFYRTLGQSPLKAPLIDSKIWILLHLDVDLVFGDL